MPKDLDHLSDMDRLSPEDRDHATSAQVNHPQPQAAPRPAPRLPEYVRHG